MADPLSISPKTLKSESAYSFSEQFKVVYVNLRLRAQPVGQAPKTYRKIHWVPYNTSVYVCNNLSTCSLLSICLDTYGRATRIGRNAEANVPFLSAEWKQTQRK